MNKSITQSDVQTAYAKFALAVSQVQQLLLFFWVLEFVCFFDVFSFCFLLFLFPCFLFLLCCLYFLFILFSSQLLNPDSLGLAAETNFIRLAAPAPVWEAVIMMTTLANSLLPKEQNVQKKKQKKKNCF
jgi:hypothetical protein